MCHDKGGQIIGTFLMERTYDDSVRFRRFKNPEILSSVRQPPKVVLHPLEGYGGLAALANQHWEQTFKILLEEIYSSLPRGPQHQKIALAFCSVVPQFLSVLHSFLFLNTFGWFLFGENLFFSQTFFSLCILRQFKLYLVRTSTHSANINRIISFRRK